MAMCIDPKIDYKELKRQKNCNRKFFKRAIKERDYDMIQQCLTFMEKYDEMVKTDKYKKYFDSMPPQTREVICLREKLAELRKLDLTIFEVFEDRLSNAITKHINEYTEKRLTAMKKELRGAKKQVDTRITKRVKAAPKVKKMNIT